MTPTARAVAIIAARNEADVIGQVIGHLVGQRVQVYLIDDGSTDATVAEAEPWLGEGLLAIERRPPGPQFDWSALLARKAAIAADLGAVWCLHHDADEFRESPWPDLDLLGAMERVEWLGYNAIDFRVLNFRPTDDSFVPGSDVRAALPRYEPAAPWDATQVKAWKHCGAVGLVESGGHDATFPGRRVCPIPFLLRHYPIRGQTHGRRKVLLERLGRFVDAERAKGWHVQYNGIDSRSSFLADPDHLVAYDAAAVKASLRETHRDTFAREQAERRVVDLERELTRLWATTSDGESGSAPVWSRLARPTPVSTRWGLDRGTPVDRHFIDRFLRNHEDDIRGHVLEVKDSGYTRAIGGHRVGRASVLDVDPANRTATVIGDLSRPGAVRLEAVDCFILTQTLHVIFDVAAAAVEAVRVLAPGGVLLCTLPAVSRVSDEDGGLESGDYWRMTAAAARRLFSDLEDVADVRIETYGNVGICAAFLYGLAAEELPTAVLEHRDPWFPLLHGVRVVKRG
jgi:SAM-dependent methyltransferase